jgi:fumarate hydratase, class II
MSSLPGMTHERGDAALKLGLLAGEQFDSWVRPEEMTHPLRRER